jgi:cell wall-associated NlpC family hydrolase
VTTTVASLLARAASQIGTYERTGNNDVLYADYYGITGYSWCYAFVQWCFEEDNARLPFTTMYVPAGVAWSRQNL